MPNVDIDLIKPSPYQPRLFFEVDDLKEEIERDGLLSAIVVRKKDEYYELLDGERRLRSLKEMGWKRVPIDIRDVDDKTARRSVFKLNKIRESYNTEEEARYYKKLADEGRTAWEVSEELNVNFHWVLAHLNVFKFPESIQKAIWDGKYLTVSHIHSLENVIGRNLDEALLMSSEIINRKLSVADTRKIVSGRDKVADEQRLEAAKVALPEVVGTLETPEDYEKAAKALIEEAERQKTPEQKAEEERRKLIDEARKSLDSAAKKIDRASEVMDVSEFREQLNNIQQTLEKEPIEAKAQLVALGQEVAETEGKAKAEAKAKAEEEKRQQKAEEERRREERSEKKARAELKGDKTFVQEALRAMPEEEVVEMLDMVPIPGKAKKVKSLEEEFDQIMKMASRVVDNLDKLKREGKLEQLDLKRFSITLQILADSLDDFAKFAEGRPLRKEARF